MTALIADMPVLVPVPPSLLPAQPVGGGVSTLPEEEEVARQALIAQLDSAEPDFHRVFAGLNDFTLQFYRRKPARARELLSLTILLGEKWFGPQVRSVAIAHLNAATIALDSRDYAACAYHAGAGEPALDLLGEALFAAHAAEMRGLVGLNAGDLSGAIAHFIRALARLEPTLGIQHARTRGVAARLALAHQKCGDTLSALLLEARFGQL